MLTLWEMAPETSDAEVRAAFSRELANFSRENGWLVRIGDAPGEVELEKLSNARWRVVYYGAYGQASAIGGDEVKVGEGLK